MLDFIRQWIVNIVTLVLFIVIVEMLLPGGKMKKYINLVTGTILIITIINPLTGLTGKKFDFTASQTKNGNTLEKAQIQKEGKNLEQGQLKQIIEVYRKNIIDQLEQNAEEIEGVKHAKADVIINEDSQSASFGEIKRAYISITADNSKYAEAEGSDESGANVGGSDNTGVTGAGEKRADKSAAVTEEGGIGNDITAVDKVEAVRIGSETTKRQAVDRCDPKLKKLIEDRISRIFGVDREHIVIMQA